jgi:predicted enzyme related to lactoylglutathione lyase
VAERSLLERLDFVYMPSSDVARDLAFYRDALGGEVVFAIEAMGTRVAQLKLGEPGPRVMLAGHLEGEKPILVFRVGDLHAALGQLESGGAEVERRLEIPQGPCATLRMPGEQRIAIYELSRPEVAEHFAGRLDF